MKEKTQFYKKIQPNAWIVNWLKIVLSKYVIMNLKFKKH